MENRCRLCAEFGADQLNALEDLNLILRIFQLFNVKISPEDKLPTTVCHLCSETVKQTWEFSQHVQKSQEILNDILNTEITQEVKLTYGSSTEEVKPRLAEICHTIKKEDLIQKPPTNKIKRNNRKKESDSELSDAEPNDDGSVTPKVELFGWNAYPWTCCDCHQNFNNSEDLREHHATVHGQAPTYSCADCPKVYTKYSTFLTHVRVHRLKLRFCCDICGKWFPTVVAQKKHRNEHGDERPHACATCGKRFRMQSALMVHARSHLPAELKNKHQCDQCPKRFGTKPNLMAHKRIHAGVRDYTCDQCGKSFVQKGNLDNHLLTHTAARPFACSTCGKAFKTLVRLRKHGSVHSGLKPHQCDVCGRKFRERGTLKEHQRIHTGAMPFTCEFCGKCFRFKGVLTTHRRQHTGERPYSCHECQHHFTNWPNYNKHMKRRHGINTSVTVRKPQSIPPTGMPHRNPPGTVLAPPQPITITESFVETPASFYPVLSLYNLPDELLQQRV
jgi:KRAB domain-containing zinc finger protein